VSTYKQIRDLSQFALHALGSLAVQHNSTVRIKFK